MIASSYEGLGRGIASFWRDRRPHGRRRALDLRTEFGLGEIQRHYGKFEGDVSDGSTFLMAVEYTDADCPTVRTLMAPQQPLRFSQKKWLPGLLCQ
ncbi:hypothetical protein FKR81_11720 [Lentzea tibetensis]|uniref:Uncharacterized protein n=1 Tax=Lentzea tibetensis TaxID=2591470 RepID=A0A563EXE6_9PSEU|nr:hypothetical protein [Lentzea tibetensis]TWP52232.1 hypothetical protein FKR81_11720 [Lentzea tibetensis]